MIIGGVFNYLACFGWLPLLLTGLLGLLLGWLLFGRNRQSGDLSVEGEGALRTEADGLRARVRELEGKVSTGDAELTSLRSQLSAAPAVATAAPAGDDEDSYALEWRNRYLAARVKYLEGRLAEAPKKTVKKATAKKATARKTVKKAAPKKAKAKKVTVKKKAPAKKKVVAKKRKAPANKAAKPKVLYTDGPTAGKPDDLKLIKGIGPKFEKDLNGKGIYYFRQIGNWKAKDVNMVEGIIDSIPGRIQRDEWVRQAKGLAKGGKPRAMKSASAKKKAPAKKKAAAKKAPAKKAAASKNQKYYDGVKRFHKSAKTGTVDNIVKYLGASLKNRDSALVACSDEKEIATVVKNFGMRKLGLSKPAAEKAAADTCAEMKPARQKNRAVFYYLMAKRVKKLSVFE